IIAVNVGVFIYMLTLSTAENIPIAGALASETDRFLLDWGLIPACLAHSIGAHTDTSARVIREICPGKGHELITPLTGMFVHAGWAHIAGNMLFLWVFGDNVEDNMGHLRYLVFYLLCGIAAALAQTLLSLDTAVPAVGASGAIAGVLAAYLILYPRAIVRVIVLPLFFIPFSLPAIILIGIWFAMQLVSGFASLGQTVAGTGIAYCAHLPRFLARPTP